MMPDNAMQPPFIKGKIVVFIGIKSFYVKITVVTLRNDCGIPLNSTVGGLDACIFCRLLHVAIITVSFFYYFYPVSTASFLSPSLHYLLLAIIAIIILFEIVRLRCKWALWGQRKRERRGISSFSWTIISLFLVLLLAPGIAIRYSNYCFLFSC
ncbi:MAG: hypothetical protein AB8Z31_02870 [Coxiella endosymbiont of Haemaphysalis qinghaiensis]